MLLGSFSGLPRGVGATSTFSTFASGFAAPRSTTSAGFWSSVGVVVQAPTNRAVVATARAAIRIARTACLLSFDEWSPRGFAYVPRGDAEPLLDAPVGRDRREHAAPAGHGGEPHHAAVGREARGRVAVAVGDDLRLLGRPDDQRALELAPTA